MSNKQWTDEEIRKYSHGSAPNAVARAMRADYEARITELQAENERLRAIVPDAETRTAIRTCALDCRTFHRGNYTRSIITVERWLDKLDAQKGETK